MGRKRNTDERRLRTLVDGLLLEEDEGLTRREVLDKIFSRGISARDLTRVLELGMAEGLVTVEKGFREYTVRRPTTLVRATAAAREAPPI